MSHQLLKAEEKEYLDLPDFNSWEKQQHPYQSNQEKTVCDPSDKECMSRLVQAFSDCD